MKLGKIGAVLAGAALLGGWQVLLLLRTFHQQISLSILKRDSRQHHCQTVGGRRLVRCRLGDLPR